MLQLPCVCGPVVLPPDALIRGSMIGGMRYSTTSRQRRRVLMGATLVAFLPGGLGTYWFRDDVWWVNLISWVALWAAFLGAWAAETPVEAEDCPRCRGGDPPDHP